MNWWESAECQYIGISLFYRGAGSWDNGRAAKRVCALCPVEGLCLEAAMSEESGLGHDLRDGVRGGLTSAERARLALARGEVLDDGMSTQVV